MFHSLEFLLSGIFYYTYRFILGASWICFSFFSFYTNYSLMLTVFFNTISRLTLLWLPTLTWRFCGLILTCKCFRLLNPSSLQCFICVNMKRAMKTKGLYYFLACVRKQPFLKETVKLNDVLYYLFLMPCYCGCCYY